MDDYESERSCTMQEQSKDKSVVVLAGAARSHSPMLVMYLHGGG